MCFVDNNLFVEFDLSLLGEQDIIKVLFVENVGVVLQFKDEDSVVVLVNFFIFCYCIGKVIVGDILCIRNGDEQYIFDIFKFWDVWYEIFWLFD